MGNFLTQERFLPFGRIRSSCVVRSSQSGRILSAGYSRPFAAVSLRSASLLLGIFRSCRRAFVKTLHQALSQGTAQTLRQLAREVPGQLAD